MAGPTEHIVIVGAMAAGKTTLGKGIAERLGLAFVDSDDQIRELTDSDGAAIAAVQGVEALHRLELEVFWEAFRSPQPTVIAAAASVIEDEAVRQALQEVRCVWVGAAEETLRGRRSLAAHRREVTDDEAMRLTGREPLFSSCADVTVDTGSVTEEDAVSIAVTAITGGDQG